MRPNFLSIFRSVSFSYSLVDYQVEPMDVPLDAPVDVPVDTPVAEPMVDSLDVMPGDALCNFDRSNLFEENNRLLVSP